MGQVGFYYDLVSPYSYVAYERVGRICEEHGADLVAPLGGHLYGSLDPHRLVHCAEQHRSQHQIRDLKRWAEYDDLPMRYPAPFPFRTLKAMPAAVWCALWRAS